MVTILNDFIIFKRWLSCRKSQIKRWLSCKAGLEFFSRI